MLLAAVIGYLVCTIGIGLYASSRVHGAKDFMVAGRSLPLYMNFTCVFATWFGAETLLSASTTFAGGGLSEVSGDPFGASACLILVAIFFARAFYRLDLLTIGDFYRKRYGKPVEVFTASAITMSYLGWSSAQLTALGLVLHVLFGETLPLEWAIVVGAVVVVVYTIFGGMWSVALTDLVQTAVIVIGLIVIAIFLGSKAGGAGSVVELAYNDGKLRLFPETENKDAYGVSQVWFMYIGTFLTMALGSIPQQDVFQRVTSAKDEKTAVRGTLLGGSFYFIFAFVPMFIAYCAMVIEPTTHELLNDEDGRIVQLIIPNLVLNHTPFIIQGVFFGALLSAILSTASGALLAPASLFTENVLKPFTPNMTDRLLLISLRLILLAFATAATVMAVNSELTMYQMVEQAYKVTLVAAFIPLVMGLYWKSATTQGAVFSSLGGALVWLAMEWFYPEGEGLLPPQLWGLMASFIGMLVGVKSPQWIRPSGDFNTPAEEKILEAATE